MITKTETETTVWVGMTLEQQGDLLKAILVMIANDEIPNCPKDLSTKSLEVLNSLREALLNV